MPIIGGITCEELNDSGQVTFSPQGLRGRRRFKVEWEDCIAFTRALLAKELEPSGGVIRRVIPTNPWILPDGTILGCNTVDITGMGKSSGDPSNIAYDHARIEGTYERAYSSQEEEDPEVLGDATIDYSAEFLATPRRTWKYKDTGYVIDENVGILLCNQDITVNLYGLDSLPWGGLRTCRGHLNDATWNGAEKGRVLFLGGSSRQSWSTEGLSSYDLVLKFKEKEYDWNWVLGKDGDWHEIVDADAGTKNPYNYAAFGDVLHW